jgi:hypothetical protein
VETKARQWENLEKKLKIVNSFLSIEIYIGIRGPKKPKEIKSIIDCVITKQRSLVHVIDVRVFRGAECGSDHYLVKGTIFWPWIKGMGMKTRQNSTESREWKPDKFNIQLLQDESIKMLYLQSMNKGLDINYDGNTEEMYGYIINTVKKISYEVLGKESGKIKRNGWISKDILEETDEKRNSYQK